MDIKNYALTIRFDNQQEYTITFQSTPLTNNQADTILRNAVHGLSNIQGVMVNPQRVLFVRLIELNTTTTDSEQEAKEDERG
jgi:hypothetical protein